MKIGIVNNESWAFFSEIAAELAAHHHTQTYAWKEQKYPVFRERLNRSRREAHFRRFLDGQDVAFFEWASEALVMASRSPQRCKIVTRLHRYELYQWAHKIDWKNVDRVILVSQAKRNEFLRRFPDQERKVIVIPEAIPIEKFPLRQRPFSGGVGTLCHLSPRKRVYELILAFAEIARSRKGIVLHIGGAGHPRFPDYEPSLRWLVQKLRLEDRVIFYGEVSDPLAWHTGIDLFVSNSYSEGLQVAPMEAIATGADCLSHAWDGAEELLPPEHLFTTERELVDRVEEFLEASPEERRRRQSMLRDKVVSEFNIHGIKTRIREVVESAAAG